MKRLFILTNSSKRMPQLVYETETLDTQYLREYFAGQYNVIEKDFSSFVNTVDPSDISNSLFFYASSQYPDYKDYIEDVLLYITHQKGVLIPRFDLFRSHENKVYQCLLSRRLELLMPSNFFVSTIEDLMSIEDNISYPIVLKKAEGFCGNSVILISDRNSLYYHCNNILTDIIPKRKNFLARRKKIQEYKGKYPLKVGKILLQEFIPNLTFDWKIRIFGDKYFTQKRFIRENDFRASGSGNSEIFSEPDKYILEFARNVFEKLDTPFASIDICVDDNKNCYLLEYQAVHFGLNAVLKASHCMEYTEQKWIKKPVEHEPITKLFCDALRLYLEKNLLESV